MQINANKVLDFCLKVWYKGANANDSHYHLEGYTKMYGCSILHNALPMGLDGTLCGLPWHMCATSRLRSPSQDFSQEYLRNFSRQVENLYPSKIYSFYYLSKVFLCGELWQVVSIFPSVYKGYQCRKLRYFPMHLFSEGSSIKVDFFFLWIDMFDSPTRYHS